MAVLVRFRTPARKDANHREIVDGLRALGVSVLELHAVGGGCPDIAWGYRGVTGLMEIKRPLHWRRGGDNKLGTLKKQAEWREAWRGRRVDLVDSLERAMNAVFRGGPEEYL